MIELLEFVFQSFWHFVGVSILLSVIITGIVEVFKAIFKCKKTKLK